MRCLNYCPKGDDRSHPFFLIARSEPADMAEHSDSNNIHTRGIADFVSELRYEQIPADVSERIKLLILDSLGCGCSARTWNGAASCRIR